MKKRTEKRDKWKLKDARDCMVMGRKMGKMRDFRTKSHDVSNQTKGESENEVSSDF